MQTLILEHLLVNNANAHFGTLVSQ